MKTQLHVNYRGKEAESLICFKIKKMLSIIVNSYLTFVRVMFACNKE